jgi:hypothetical protein
VLLPLLHLVHHAEHRLLQQLLLVQCRTLQASVPQQSQQQQLQQQHRQPPFQQLMTQRPLRVPVQLLLLLVPLLWVVGQQQPLLQ